MKERLKSPPPLSLRFPIHDVGTLTVFVNERGIDHSHVQYSESFSNLWSSCIFFPAHGLSSLLVSLLNFFPGLYPRSCPGISEI